jgi:hypothetical protein
MHPHKDAERTAYYRQQASSCATAALITAIAEIRQAYLDLEQGWLCLAPKGAQDDPPDPASQLKTDPSPNHDAGRNASRRDNTEA